MIERPPHTPRVVQLAARIEQDMRQRGVRPGEPYRSTTEIVDMLGVGRTLANRAMQLLVKRGLLDRRQRRGTTIAKGFMETAAPALRCVHFLVHQNYLKTEGMLADGTIIGLQAELPGVDVQLNFLPLGDEGDTVNRVIAAALRVREPEGIVLVRASLMTQRLVQASGLPAVVHGTLYPSVQGLPWIDRDHRGGARLLTEYMLKRGHRRIVLLMRDRNLPGEHPFMDTIYQVAAEAGLDATAIRVRHLPADQGAIEAEVCGLLQTSREPLGIIAHTEPLAQGVVAAANSLGMALGRDLTLAQTLVYRQGNENPLLYPHLRTSLTPQQIGTHISRMLARQARGQHLEPDYEVIPVHLEEPEGGDGG